MDTVFNLFVILDFMIALLCSCVKRYIYVCVCVCVCVCTHTYRYIQIHTHTCLSINTHGHSHKHTEGEREIDRKIFVLSEKTFITSHNTITHHSLSSACMVFFLSVYFLYEKKLFLDNKEHIIVRTSGKETVRRCIHK